MQKPVLDKNAMIKWLGDVIEAEIKKPDNEIDTALIVECSEYLDELLSDIQISDEQMKNNIAKIKNRSCDTTNTASTRRSRRTPRMRRFIAAICAAVLLLSGTVSAYAFIPAFRNMIREVLKLGQDASIDDGGVTYIYCGKTVTYKNIEELVLSESLDIIYPHNLPEELKIKSITASGEGDTLTYSISFVDNSASISIRCGESEVSQLSDKCEIYVNSNNITSYILVNEERVVSTTVYKGWTYYVTAHNVSYITTILENLY